MTVEVNTPQSGSRTVLWKVSVRTTAEAADAVVELLAGVFALPAVADTDFETQTTTVSVYCPRHPADFPVKRTAVLTGLARSRAAGLEVGVGRVTMRPLRRENWADSWKRHFKPVEIGKQLLIKPSWSRRRPRRGQAAMVLDPGLSFGTGQHPTTLFCLREIARYRQRDREQSCLDLGTGSGILAIAAAKLGYAPIQALDSDPTSVAVARANARANRVAQRMRIARRDLAGLPLRSARRHDLICANLISLLHIAHQKRIVRRLKPGGILVLAGILRSDFDSVAAAYGRLGLRLMRRKTEKEWCSGSFLAPHWLL